MAKYVRGSGEHLAPLLGFETIDSDPSSSSDSEVEVVSTYDAVEHELVQLGEYLHLGSDSDKDVDAEDEEKETIISHILWCLIRRLMIPTMVSRQWPCVALHHTLSILLSLIRLAPRHRSSSNGNNGRFEKNSMRFQRSKRTTVNVARPRAMVVHLLS